jgi:hypothetical protein
VVVVSRVVVVSVVVAPIVLLEPVELEPVVLEPVEPDEPEPDEPDAPMELPVPVLGVVPVEPDVPVEPAAPIEEVLPDEGAVVDDEPLEAVSALGVDEEPVVEPLVPEPEAPIVLDEPPAALEPALSAVAGLPATGAPGAALGAGLTVEPLAAPPPPPDAPPEPPDWATAIPLMARVAAAASAVSVFLVALMSTP